MKYWAYINNEILGPYEKEKLLELPVFSASTLICPQTPVGEKTQDWKEASTYPEVAALLKNPGAAAAPPAAGGAPAAEFKPEPGPASAHLPKPDAVGPESKLERPLPVFNTEMPESKLKPLSLHKIEQAPPAAAPHIEGANSGASRPGEAKGLPAPEALGSAPSFNSANFNPMTLSQISKRADAQMPEAAPVQAPAAPAIEANGPAAASFNPAPVPVFEAPAPAPVRQAPAAAAPADNRSFDEISSRLDALARTALTRQDIEPLSEKLGQLGEAVSSVKSGQFQREIMDKLQQLESSVSEIRASLSQAATAAPSFDQAPAPAAQSPQPAAAEISPFGVTPPRPAQKEAAGPVEPAKPAEQADQGIVDQGTSGRTSKFAGVIKKIFKLLVTLVLLAAVSGGAAFALKKFGVFDVTKFLPFPVPFLSSSPAEPAGPAPQAFQQSGEAQAVNQGAGQAGADQAEPPKKDLSPEVIYIGRTYAVQPGGETLENMIYKDAAARKGNSNKTAWDVKELPGNLFEMSGVIPLQDNSGQLVYRYEVDYERKSVKPLDEASKKPMDALLKAREAAQPGALKTGKGRKGQAQAAAKPPAAPKRAAPAAKPAKAKPAAPADDEYEYVYEEEAGGTGE